MTTRLKDAEYRRTQVGVAFCPGEAADLLAEGWDASICIDSLVARAKVQNGEDPAEVVEWFRSGEGPHEKTSITSSTAAIAACLATISTGNCPRYPKAE